MPLDTSIPLQAISAGDVASKDLAQLQQAQAARGQLQLQQYGIAQAKSDFEDQQNMKAAWREACGDPDKTLAIAARLGVSPKAVTAFQTQQAELRGKLDAHQKATDEHGKSQLDQMNERNSMIQAGLNPLLTAKDDIEFHTKLPGVIQSLKNQKLLTDDEALLLAKAPNSQAVQDWSFGHNNVDILSKQLKVKSDQQTADAATTRATTESDKQARLAASQIEESKSATLQSAGRELNNALTDGPVAYQRTLEKLVAADKTGLVAANFPTGDKVATMTPAAVKSAIDQGTMTGKDREAANQAKAALIQKTQNDELIRRQGAQNTAIAMEGLKIRRAEYEAQYGDPANASDGVKKIAQGLIAGDIAPAEVRRMKGGQQALGIAISTPGWTDQRYAVLKSFKSGKDADDLKNLVMLDGHMDRLTKNSAATGYTGLINPFSTSATKLKTDANDVSGIMGRLTKGGMLSVKEHQEYMDRLLSKLPGKREAAADELKELLVGKIDGMKQKFRNGTGWELPDSMLGNAAPTKASGPADLKSMSTDDLLKQLGGK